MAAAASPMVRFYMANLVISNDLVELVKII